MTTPRADGLPSQVTDDERLAVLVDSVELVERWLAAGAVAPGPRVQWPAPDDRPLQIDPITLAQLRARIDACVATAESVARGVERELGTGERRRSAARQYLSHQPRPRGA